MAASSTRRQITDDLLEISVRIKREAGVGQSQIQTVVDRFASRDKWEERTGGIGFPLVEDIPQSGREGFMAALAELMPEPSRATAGGGRKLSVTEIWPARV